MTRTPVPARLAALRVRHLTLLELIARFGSLSKAADVLCVSQPVVTAMLKELEMVFEGQLVERGRQGARLTPFGAGVQVRLAQALNALEALDCAARMIPAAWHLRVGVLNSGLLNMVADAVARIRRSKLCVTFQFVETSPQNSIKGVLDGTLDCALGRIGGRVLQPLRARDLRVTHLHSVPLKIFAASGHRILRRPTLALQDLLECNWVLLPHETESRQVFDHAFSQNGLVPPAPVVESKSLSANFRLVAKTELLGIAPETALRDFAPPGIRCLRLEWPVGLSSFVFACRGELADQQPIVAFRDALLASDPGATISQQPVSINSSRRTP